MPDPIEVMARAILSANVGPVETKVEHETLRDHWWHPQDTAGIVAQTILDALAAAGLEVLPREPTPVMSVAGVNGDPEEDSETWRQMWAAAP